MTNATEITRRAALTGIGASALYPSSSSLSFEKPFNPPEEYGRVIGRIRPESANQLYIISQIHRSSRKTNEDIVRVQRDIYRIQEYLHREKGSRLLLREGASVYTPAKRIIAYLLQQQILIEEEHGPIKKLMQGITDEKLSKILSSNTNNSTAFSLLCFSQLGTMYGVEDPKMLKVAKEVRDLPFSWIRSSKQYIEANRWATEVRTAQILGFAPLVAEAFYKGANQQKSATIALGYLHIDEVLDFAEKNKAVIPKAGRFKGLELELSLKQKEFGVTVIVPQSLPEDMYEKSNSIGQLRCSPEPLLSPEGIESCIS